MLTLLLGIRHRRAMAKRQEAEQQSRLLCLPGEIRNHIYRLAVVENEPIETRFRPRGGSFFKEDIYCFTSRRPSLAATSRQLRRGM